MVRATGVRPGVGLAGVLAEVDEGRRLEKLGVWLRGAEEQVALGRAARDGLLRARRPEGVSIRKLAVAASMSPTAVVAALKNPDAVEPEVRSAADPGRYPEARQQQRPAPSADRLAAAKAALAATGTTWEPPPDPANADLEPEDMPVEGEFDAC